jgi:hypothetical protein
VNCVHHHFKNALLSFVDLFPRNSLTFGKVREVFVHSTFAARLGLSRLRVMLGAGGPALNVRALVPRRGAR